MATTAYGVNNPLAVKAWRKKLFLEALKQCWLSKFMGKDDRMPIQIMDDVQKGPGDRITVGLRMQLTGNGVLGDGTLEGNEEALTTYSDNLLINQLRHAVRSDGKMSEQRVPFSVREQARLGLQDWWSDRIDTALFNQLCGNTAQADTRFTGQNATSAPSSNNWYFANGLANETQVASAGASNIFKLSFLDVAVERAKTNTPMIRPIKVNGEDKYLAFLHPYQVTAMRQNTNSGQWLDIQKTAMAGMDSKKSPIYTGALGEYNGVVIHSSTRIPSVVATVYRALFCGAQAGAIGFGQNSAPDKMTWVEELFDYGNQLGVSAGLIFGAKKMVFNSQDFGTIVISTYAAAS